MVGSGLTVLVSASQSLAKCESLPPLFACMKAALFLSTRTLILHFFFLSLYLYPHLHSHARRSAFFHHSSHARKLIFPSSAFFTAFFVASSTLVLRLFTYRDAPHKVIVSTRAFDAHSALLLPESQRPSESKPLNP